MKYRKRLIAFVSMMTVVAMLVPALAVFAQEPAPETTEQTEETAPAVTLKFGDLNDEVAAMQTCLIKLGLLNDQADGSFGNMTRSAVEAFQETFSLPVTGEMTPDDLAVLQAYAGVIAELEEGTETDPVFTEEFFGIPIDHYEDGTMGAEKNTIPTGKIEELEALLSVLTTVRDAEEEVPQADIIWVLSIDTTDLPEDSGIAETMSLNDLVALAVERQEAIQVTDVNGNEITVGKDGSITSSTGNIAVYPADYDTGEALEETADAPLESLSWKKPAEIWFRTVRIGKDDNGNFVIPVNSISDRTLQESWTLYAVVHTAYVLSTEIPEEDDTESEDEKKTETEEPTTPASNTAAAAQPAAQAPSAQQQQAAVPATPTPAPVPQYTPAPAPAPSSTPAAPAHEHTWVPITSTVHHDAVTHQEPVYTVVHHDAVTHEEPVYEQVPIYETISYYVCTACGRRSDEFASIQDFVLHQIEDGGSGNNMQDTYIAGYETKQTGTQTIVDSPAYDETVTSYTTVTDSAAWDETVTTGYQCSSCGATQ